eukprot:scaffold979_cov382-Prasinococcus_capsulatus_cf.AAC.6
MPGPEIEPALGSAGTCTTCTATSPAYYCYCHCCCAGTSCAWAANLPLCGVLGPPTTARAHARTAATAHEGRRTRSRGSPREAPPRLAPRARSAACRPWRRQGDRAPLRLARGLPFRRAPR